MHAFIYTFRPWCSVKTPKKEKDTRADSPTPLKYVAASCIASNPVIQARWAWKIFWCLGGRK